VDDSEVAQRFMANCLGHFGYDVHRAFSGEEALSRIAAEPYAFVFMDVNMPGIDGYQACKLIKKRPYPVGRSAPVVVMLTSRGGVIDESALIRALQEDRLYGAALDVLATEPLELDHPLLALDPRRVILTPHFGAWCAASVPDLHAEVAAALAAMLAGRWPVSTMNPDVTQRLSLQK